MLYEVITPDAATASHPEVAPLVDGDENRQRHHEGEQVPQRAGHWRRPLRNNFV